MTHSEGSIWFKAFPKIPRWYNEEVIITEKIDGTNACVAISEDLSVVSAQSRTRLLSIDKDNYGFALWVWEHTNDLRQLGPGHHFGEWWGSGIQRNYGLQEKRFSLFNTSKWKDDRPNCCHVVPELYSGNLSVWGELLYDEVIDNLFRKGSKAAPGFMEPEGVMMYLINSKQYYKVPFEGNPKSTPIITC